MLDTVSFCIQSLVSGGVITNYACTSQCRHCLYACSPQRQKDYIDDRAAQEAFKTIKSLRCNSIHLGGGEPFLAPDRLVRLTELARQEGLYLEYAETNCSWYTDRETACELLRDLKAAGLGTLLVSISPFHNEYVPFAKTKGVIEACTEAGVSVFPWVLDFHQDLERFDETKTHCLAEFETLFGDGYIRSIPSRYWIHMGGRALSTFAPYMEKKSAGDIISRERHGCRELLDTSHFHCDLFDNYIPGLCSGLCLKRQDLGTEISADRYPILTELFHHGIKGLYDMARTQYGYETQKKFVTKCDVCTDIRLFLVIDCGVDSPELQPEGFYRQLASERSQHKTDAGQETE